MKDALISVRLDSKLKAAVDTAAKADQRSTSSLVALIVAEWAKARGLLDEPPQKKR